MSKEHAAISRLRTDQVLAEWRCAESVLSEFGDGAEEFLRSKEGLGLRASEVELLCDLVARLRAEKG